MAAIIRPIAFYLPQFYPLPKNDSWLGNRYTDWKKVIQAPSLFKNHYQPHIPSDLGFYDLRLSEVREEQAQLARSYGIFGFCYYHYWLNGNPLWERPFAEVLSSDKPDFPFCLCWANDNWTKKTNSQDTWAEPKQKYSLQDDIKHIRHLFQAFEDKRYIKIGNKPVFMIYRTELFPDIRKTAELWRNEAVKYGFEDLYLIKVESHTSIDPKHIGFDAAIEYQPDWQNIPPANVSTFTEKLLSKLKIRSSPTVDHKIISYEDLMEKMINKSKVNYKLYRGVTPSWDNSALKHKDSFIIHDSRPEYYEKWLKTIVKNFTPYSEEENFIFINAWNQWAEGNHLEPCVKWGKAYLEATLNALKDA